MNFIEGMKDTLENEFNMSVTENGAIGYRTTGKALLDLNFAVASLRNGTIEKIAEMFTKAYYEDKKTALTWLFYARDVRGGLGERRLFRVILNHLSKNNENVPVRGLMNLVAEYGRFDDLWQLLETTHKDKVVELIKSQIDADIKGMGSGESISLLAKWLPSVNASNDKARANARLIAGELGMTWGTYRKTLSRLRKYLDVVECKMSANQFDEIKYEAVPSRANLIYNKAFFKRDEERRTAYLESLKKGETKINAGVLHPHEIVHAYMGQYDETLEQLWKALPEMPDLENAIVVADGSGSMMCPVGGSSCTALAVANALAIYFAERCSGQFKDKYITFSERPQLVDLANGKTLKEKLQIASAHNEVSNTNIYKVFKLILQTAVKHSMAQSEVPKNIVIISDMEFDSGISGRDERLFTQIAEEYEQNGYKLPRLVFWNVNSRTGTIPVKENDLGVALVSGFSISIAKMVMSLELDPYKCLLDILNDQRYDAVRDAIQDLGA